jgi:uncharacterized protein YggU (UPF0235/DUF167 family)
MFIKVKAHTGSKKESIIKKSEDAFEVFVKEKPERNLANKRILELIALKLKVAKNKVKIITGHHWPSKILEIIE